MRGADLADGEGAGGGEGGELYGGGDGGVQGGEGIEGSDQLGGGGLCGAEYAGLQDVGGVDAIAGQSGDGVQRAAVVGEALGVDRAVDEVHWGCGEPGGACA